MNLATRLLALATICAAALGAAAPATAQTWPERPIRIVVPATAGGPTDVLARLLAERLRIVLGQTALIDNRAGAGGAIAARAVAAAPADGYTLLFGNTATFATVPAVSKGAGYDGLNSFAPVAKVMDSYQVLVTSPDLPVKSVAELVAYARANPGKLNYSTAGIGNITHLSGELLKARAGIAFEAIHYKSGGESLNAILGGQAQLSIDNITAVRALVQDKRLRALAVTSATRKPEFPDLPTLAEAGVADLVITSFFGIAAPAGTPPAIIARLNGVINDTLRTEAFQESLRRLGAQASPESPEQFRALIAGELKKWTEISNATNIKLE